MNELHFYKLHTHLSPAGGGRGVESPVKICREHEIYLLFFSQRDPFLKSTKPIVLKPTGLLK